MARINLQSWKGRIVYPKKKVDKSSFEYKPLKKKLYQFYKFNIYCSKIVELPVKKLKRTVASKWSTANDKACYQKKGTKGRINILNLSKKRLSNHSSKTSFMRPQKTIDWFSTIKNSAQLMSFLIFFFFAQIILYISL